MYQKEGFNNSNNNNNIDDGNNNKIDLMESNRNLSAAMEKIELRCKVLEEKVAKYKQYKKMCSNSTALQCLHCNKLISNSIFYQHLNSCLTQVFH